MAPNFHISVSPIVQTHKFCSLFQIVHILPLTGELIFFKTHTYPHVPMLNEFLCKITPKCAVQSRTSSFRLGEHHYLPSLFNNDLDLMSKATFSSFICETLGASMFRPQGWYLQKAQEEALTKATKDAHTKHWKDQVYMLTCLDLGNRTLPQWMKTGVCSWEAPSALANSWLMLRVCHMLQRNALKTFILIWLWSEKHISPSVLPVLIHTVSNHNTFCFNHICAATSATGL